MALLIPLDAIPAQTLTVSLGGLSITLTLAQKSTGLFVTIALAGVMVLSNVLALQAVRLVRDAYLGFPGDLAFFDTEGSDDPDASGLGGRWVLAYFTAAELGALS